MKRLLTLFVVVAAMSSIMSQAQDNLWKRNTAIRISYDNLDMKFEDVPGTDKFSPYVKSNMGFGISNLNTYWVGKPIANMLRFGIDATWIDLSYVNYAKGDLSKLSNIKFDMDEDDFEDGSFDSVDDFTDGLSDNIDLGVHQLSVGLGVGPRIGLMPFGSMDNAARHLRLSLYGHVLPSYNLILQSHDGKNDFSHGFCLYGKFGGEIQWKWIALGAEGRWGKSKFNALDINGMLEGDSNDVDVDVDADEPAGKVKYQFKGARVYVAFHF